MRVNQLREFSKDFHNLVGTFTTSSNDYNISFRLLGYSMLEHRFTCTERSGNKSCTSLYYRIDRINHTYAGFQQFERARFFFIIRHGTFHRPLLNHIYLNFIPFFISQDSNCILNAVITFLNNRLDSAYSFLFKRDHDFQWLEIFIYLTQPCCRFHLISDFSQRYKMPFAFLIQRIRVLSAFQKNTIHLVEVILQTIVVFRKHTRTQCHFKHVSSKLCFGSYFQSASAFKHLHINLSAYHFNNLRHQSVSASRDITNLVLCHRTVNGEGYHISYYATNSSFCCHIIL